MSSEVSTLKTNIATIKDDVQFYKQEIECLKGIVIRQDQEIQECRSQIEHWQYIGMRPNLIVSGIEVCANEDCVQLIKSFFKDTMEIQDDIHIVSAFRFKGSGRYRAICVKLAKSSDKALIFKNTGKLKDKTNSANKPFCINDQLTGKRQEKR